MKPENLEVIMRIDFSATDGEQIVAHAEKVQELVRCGECKWWDTDWTPIRANEGEHYCIMVDKSTDADWYCADGERKGEEK